MVNVLMDFNLNPYVSAILNDDVLFVTLGTSSTKLTERSVGNKFLQWAKWFTIMYTTNVESIFHFPFTIQI